VGNILNIYDYKTASPQTQTFTYDDLYRLLTASAIGGTEGTYSETYTYDSNTGNLASKTGMGTYTYGSSDHAHAVTATSGKSYGYDANGNQITRVIGSITYTLSYDVENRLVSVSWAIGSTNHSMAFVFDGDGNRVKSTLDGTTTTFAGTHYEVTGSAVTKYYYSGASRIAMRSSIGVRYIFGDHLGSASVTADMYGSSVTRQLYKPYGETRSSGSVPTKYTFTGQYSYSTEIGLMYYVARFFDPQLGRFLSADTIVPQMWNSLSWDRYLYVFGNALRYTDPSGHNPTCMIATDDGYCVKWSDGRKQDPFAEYRPVLSEEIIRKIMLNVLAESQMGIYPDKVLAYTTWALINRYRNPDEYDEPLTNGYIELLKLFKGSWEAAYNAYSSKGNGFYDAFSNVKKIVMDVYHQYLGGHDDPTNGAISFSHSNKLTRDVIVNGEVIRTDTFQDFNDVEQWMRDMAARKKHKESYFYYLIVQFTCIERSGAEKTVIFYVGNDECASTGNCGVGYPPLPKKEK
jgi:RHS repeat-associated protein